MLCEKNSCGYFKWWVSNRNDFNNGFLFEGCVSTNLGYAILAEIENDEKAVKTTIEKSQKFTKSATAAKAMLILNGLFFVFNFVMYLI